jgi:hypothetical protein
VSSGTIVFCTTCKGRTQHLKLTLPKNLADNPGPDSKFVILDYSSNDGLLDYLRANHTRDIESGKLAVWTYRTNGPFRMSHAKNMAARLGILAGADILVTVDADNFTGPNLDRFIAEQFRVPGIFLCPNFPLIKSLPHGPLRPKRGYAGRLAIRAMDFIKAGGYDETFETWRGEDMDMIFRLERMGYMMRHIGNQYLETIPHDAEVRFKEYPHARQYENKGEIDVIDARTETVVNYGNIGCGHVRQTLGALPEGTLWHGRNGIELKRLPTRIFGIGMHKTATTSLHHGLQILGFDSFHWGTGEAPLIWQEMNSLGRSKTLERHYALSDLPIPLLYLDLDAAYPGSKFILTVRNEVDWLRSVSRLWDYRYNPTRHLWDIYPFSNTIHKALYGQKYFDALVFLERYRRHNAEVLDYFKDRPNDLLVMDMDKNAGWKELCGFLGGTIPSCPYPKAYPTRHGRHRSYST